MEKIGGLSSLVFPSTYRIHYLLSDGKSQSSLRWSSNERGVLWHISMIIERGFDVVSVEHIETETIHEHIQRGLNTRMTIHHNSKKEVNITELLSIIKDL